jgi:hypothetical protein
MSYRDQFPDYDSATMPEIPAGWQDASRRNDSCPFFIVSQSLGVSVDYAKLEDRECQTGARFIVMEMRDGQHFESGGFLLETDDWKAVRLFVAAREYIEIVGYDPFEDDPAARLEDIEAILVEVRACISEG